MIGPLVAAVFAVKLLVLWQLADHPLLHPDAGLDTTAYAELARRAAAGDLWLGPGLYYVSPLYIYVLAAALAAAGTFEAARLMQAALGTAAVWFVYLAARTWFGARAGVLAAALAALTGLFTFYEVLILQSSIDAFLTSAGLYALARGLRAAAPLARAPAWVLAAGIVFGIQGLNRPNVPLAVAMVGIVLLVLRRVRPAALLAAGLLIGLSPALLRNVAVAGEWSFGSSHGGLNFYIGNHERATGFFQPVAGISPTIAGQARDTRRLAEQAEGRPLSDAEVSRHFFRRGWAWIAAHPVDAARLFTRKLAFVFSAHHVALPHSYPFYAHDERTALRFLPVGPWLLVPLGVIGLLCAVPATDRREYAAWAAFVPAYAAAVSVFFVAERYRLPLLVPLAVGGGAALDRTWDLVATRRAPVRAMVAIAAGALLALAVNRPLGLHDGRWEEGLRTAQRLIIVGRYADADRYVERFEPRGPYRGATHYGAALQLLTEGQPQRAVAHLRAAHALDPSRAAIDQALGRALLAAGDPAAARPHLERGFAAGSDPAGTGYDLALALHTTGDSPATADVIRRIPAASASDAEGSLRLGRLAAQARAPEVADAFFRRAVDLRPDQASAHQQFGLNLLVLGRHDEAAAALAEAARLDGRNADTLAHLAYCEIKLGRVDGARRHVDAALAAEPQHDLARQLDAALGRSR